ncbi:YIP1 family protein [Tenacibaculum ovolyticum]|uniref:YIP1 family protein n=1 Tax=Tenacibaculum ovolyticum TaxID=104270 RepID=UPI003BA9965A
MMTPILLLFNIKKGFIRFEEKYIDELYKESFITAIFYGIILSVQQDAFNKTETLILNAFLFIISVCLWLLLVTLFSYFTYKMVIFFKGEISYEETFSLLVYAYFPIFLLSLLMFFLRNPNLEYYDFNTIHFRNLITILINFISFRILFKGLKRISKISFAKTIIVTLPVLLIPSFFYLLYIFI